MFIHGEKSCCRVTSKTKLGKDHCAASGVELAVSRELNCFSGCGIIFDFFSKFNFIKVREKIFIVFKLGVIMIGAFKRKNPQTREKL